MDRHAIPILARVLANRHELAFTDLAGMTPRFAEIAGRMVGQNGSARTVWQEWLGEQTDAAAILQALVVVNVAAPAAEATVGPRLRTRKLSTITAKPVEYLRDGAFLKGAFQMLVGDPGLGKTRILLQALAAETRGRQWPYSSDSDGAAGEPGYVLYVGHEDSAERVIRPVVVDALGGDSSRFEIIDSLEVQTRKGPRDSMFTLSPEGLEALDAKMREVRPTLMVIDPIGGHLGGADSFKDSEVRERLMPLAHLADTYGTAIVGNSHMNKDQQKAVAYRVGGAIAFYAVARAVYYVATDPAEPTRRAFFHQKGNMAELREAMGFSIVGHYLNPELGSVGVPSWDTSPVEFTLEDALRAASEGPDAHQKRETAPQTVLRTILLSRGGRAPSEEVYSLAETMGVSRRSLERAKDGIGVTSHREGFGPGSTSYWCLPAYAPSAPKAAA
ncbi:MAG: hypothetical protein AVDCRST_MAG77-2681 [uncultured Chloroflexi bacterium]|uniref:AAA+ ATPase domain-containing protein n=1 Tax=uncultured Chloroflexota bacterium TaxID=166587 RepID=A0A6J4IVP1_9CHLR|nr:MAG: hypothetical protein AVDCRST_MAG77-2681 [uncultured Chloroflexota bacterium]